MICTLTSFSEFVLWNTSATINTEFVHDFKDNYNLYIKKVNNKNKKLKLAVEIALRISNGTSTYERKILQDDNCKYAQRELNWGGAYSFFIGWLSFSNILSILIVIIGFFE